ncbi:MAG: DNA repair protein RecO [Cyclobacteriaceae bacterium]|nr:DNA repair protein RecO [Cyclobacteriaceae bacterium]
MSKQLKTRGIVLKYFKYRETSVIVHVFTEKFGRQSFIVNGIRSAKRQGGVALFQPLTLLELVVYYKEGSDIHRLSEFNVAEPLNHIYTAIKKSSIALFMAEVLNKSIKEQMASEDMFWFIYHAIQILESLKTNYENFHLQFLIKLARYLGFGADMLMEHDNLYADMARLPFDHELKISYSDRMRLLNELVSLYKSHVDGFGQLKSVEILREVLSG